MASVVLLSEAAFELFHKDREVIHLSQIEVEQAFALLGSVGFCANRSNCSCNASTRLDP